MKRTLISLLAAFSLTTAGTAAAQPGDTEITASGTGTVALTPDVAMVNATVETNAETAGDAISQNNARYDRIVGALAKLGIARSDATLAYYNVNYNPRPAVLPSNPSGERYGYTVTRSFTVKVRRIGSAGSVSDACIAAGATGINGVSFGLSDPRAARSEAIAKAVAEARTNAEALARAASLRIVGMKSVQLANSDLTSPMPVVMARASAPTQFDQSNVNVTLSVVVVFLAKP